MGVSADASVRVWTRLFGTSSADAALDLGVGLDGAVYLAGYSNGSLDGQTYSGSGDAFLTKYGADGIKAWSRLLGTSASDIANALTIGLDGSIYVAGDTEGALDGQTSGGDWDAFLTKYAIDGSKAWTRLLGSAGEDFARALATGLDGSVYVAGTTNGALDAQAYVGGTDAFLSKYSPEASRSGPGCSEAPAASRFAHWPSGSTAPSTCAARVTRRWTAKPMAAGVTPLW